MVQKDDSEEQLKRMIYLRIRHHHFLGTVSSSHKAILWLQATWNIEHKHTLTILMILFHSFWSVLINSNCIEGKTTCKYLNISLLVLQIRKSWFGMTWGWVNNDTIYFFWVNCPFKSDCFIETVNRISLPLMNSLLFTQMNHIASDKFKYRTQTHINHFNYNFAFFLVNPH